MASGMAMNFEEPHPFDSAFKIIKEMRSELQDLRAALNAERQQRSSDVKELKSECNQLREALAREVSERSNACLKLTTDFSKQSAASGKGIDELRALSRQQLGQLNQALQDEVRDRKAAEHILDTKEITDVAERKADHDRLQHDVSDHKQQFSQCRDDHSTRIGNLTHDMELVVTYLQKISSAWDCLKGGKILSSTNKLGATSAPSSPVAGGRG